MNVTFSPDRMRRLRHPLLLAAPAAVLAASLAGCASDNPNAFAPACAPVGILGVAADYSDYGNSGAATVADLSRLVSQGSIIGVSGHCSDAAGGTQLHTAVQVSMAISRGPVAPSGTIPVPYFIAVLQNGNIVSKQNLTANANFPSNADNVSVKTDPVTFDLPVSRHRPSSSYRIEVGFQLTPEQIAYNRAHSPAAHP